MRNRFGVEIKKGHWVYAQSPETGEVEGRVLSIGRTDKLVKLDSGYLMHLDDIRQTLGPMTISKRGIVKQNPENPVVKVSMRKNPVDQDELRSSSSLGVKASKTNLREKVETLAKTLKLHTRYETGGISLEAGNGGYMLIQYVSDSGAERNLSARLSASEMQMFLDGAIMVARAVK